MAGETFALTGYANAADLARQNPGTQKRYGYVASLGRAFQWAANDATAIDNVDVIGSVSYAGRWRSISPLDASDQGSALGNADATIVVASGTWRTLPAGVLTADHTLTLGTTGALKGNRFTITRLDVGAFTYAIVNGGVGGGTLVTMPTSKRAGLVAQFDGTNWLHRSSGLLL